MKAFRIGKKGVAVFLHVAFWVLLFALPFLLRYFYDTGGRALPPLPIAFVYHHFISVLTWVALFYTNAFVLLPRLFFKRRYGAYVLGVAGLLAVLFTINFATFGLLQHKHAYRLEGAMVMYLFPSLFVLAVSTAYKMLQDRLEQDKRAAQREALTLKTELDFLRSQVSPHFMFNVLNSMVALARKKSDLLEPSLIKLSGLLRYMLYETDGDKVPLEKEIDYLQNYIDLQQQRFQNQVQVKTSLSEVDDYYEIAPMLLIPFVENAFKHGAGTVRDASIDICLRAVGGRLEFGVRNKYLREGEEVKDPTSGIGLANVVRRLNLLYRDRHTLAMGGEGDWFSVSLTINLS